MPKISEVLQTLEQESNQFKEQIRTTTLEMQRQLNDLRSDLKASLDTAQSDMLSDMTGFSGELQARQQDIQIRTESTILDMAVRFTKNSLKITHRSREELRVATYGAVVVTLLAVLAFIVVAVATGRLLTLDHLNYQKDQEGVVYVKVLTDSQGKLVGFRNPKTGEIWVGLAGYPKR